MGGAGLAVVLLLIVGIGLLAFFLIKNFILPRRAAAAAERLTKGNVYKAIRSAKAAVEKNPQDAEAHYLLGRAYLADGRNEQAFREYRSASRLGIEGKNIPEREFREAMAGLYAQFKEEEEALKEYVLLIKSHPENPEYYFQAGKLFSSRNKGDLADQYLRKAVSLNPREESYRFELGMHYYGSKRIKEAAGEFDASLKLNPTNGQSLLYMGKIFKDAKNYTGAIPYLERAARDQDCKLRALVELGSCYMSLKTMDRAIAELERGVACITNEAEGDSLYARYFLAMCYENTREFTKALAQWDKIYAQKKNFRDVGEKLTQYIDYRTEGAGKESTRRP